MQVDCIHAVMAVSAFVVVAMIGQIILRPPVKTQLFVSDSAAIKDRIALATARSAEPNLPSPKHHEFTSGYV